MKNCPIPLPMPISSYLILFTVSLGVMVSPVHAEFRLATVDINRIINDIEESQKEKEELNRLSKKAKKEIEREREKLKNTEEKIKSGKIKEGSAQAEKFRADAREFTRLIQDKEEDLKRKFLKLNKRLTEKVLVTIREYAEKNSIDLVLDSSSASRGPVLFGTEANDITEQVIKQINRKS